MIAWPSSLVSDLARRKTVLVLGSGISRGCANAQGKHPKTWLEFLSDLMQSITPNRHLRSLLREKDYLTACEVAKYSLGKDAFNDALRAEYLTPAYQHSPLQESIFKLDSRLVATPNFDKIYETYANHQAGASIVVKHQFDPDVAAAIRETGRLILKIHGTIDSTERMIFTREEYAQARERHRSFYSVLEALALTHTFLFLGCGVNDPDVRLLLEDTFFRHPGSRAHIFVLPVSALHKTVRSTFERSMNISILPYSAAHDHQELGDSVAELVNIVEEERDKLRISGNW
jgi:hypothetical protein